MDSKDRIVSLVEEKKDFFANVSDRVWETPELGFMEYKSAATLMGALEAQGFKVEKGLAGIETAFSGTWGSGKPVIAFLGEFDALPSLSQKAALGIKDPVVPGGNGHGCGHNILGAASMSAATALKDYMSEKGIPGTVIYYGCPAEESGCGKTFMARDGVFDGCDVAITWHPGDTNSIMSGSTLANIHVRFWFKGKAAHAAASPHLGRSALDAAEIMNIGVNFLREHVIPEARIHYAFEDVGGGAPNVVQDSAQLLYFIRAPKNDQVMELYPRVVKCAEGAAHMTETEVRYEIITGLSDYIPNDTLAEVMSDCMQELGPQKFSDEARKVGDDIFASLSPANIRSGIASLSGHMDPAKAPEKVKEKLIADPFPYVKSSYVMPGSTDVGDVSYVVPTVQCGAVTQVIGTPGHSWQVTAQSCSALAHDGLVYGAQTMALTGLRLLEKPELIEKAKAEHFRATKGIYNCPIPKEVKPLP